MELLGLFFEIIFLVMGVYVYLFSIGKAHPRNPQARERAEAFRAKNGGWVRYLALLLVAIMTVNVVLHVLYLLKK